MKTIMLKPCPECKRLSGVALYMSVTTRWKQFEIGCRFCGFHAKHAFTKRGAIKKWNRMARDE